MYGGATVRSKEDAKTLSDLLGRTVEQGEEVREPPCVPEHFLEKIREKTGQRCPRPDATMAPDLALDWELVFLSLNEHTRHLVKPVLEASAISKSERLERLLRVAHVLRSEVVVKRLAGAEKTEPA